jgi:antitoxin component HigA of HigAB toxin-antitoxin module
VELNQRIYQKLHHIIEEILTEKRTMTVKQIKGFAKFLGVPETTFLG